MKTIRDILDILIAETMTSGRAGTGKAEALKELEKVLVECKPEKPKTKEEYYNNGYRNGIDDYEKNIKKVLG